LKDAEGVREFFKILSKILVNCFARVEDFTISSF